MTAADGGGEQFEDGGFALLPRHTKVRATPYRGEPEGDHRSEDASVSSSSRAERAGLFLSLSVPRVSSRARATRVATPHPRGPSASIASYRKTTRRAAPRIRPRPPRGRPPSNLPRDGSTRTERLAERAKTFGGWADLRNRRLPSSKSSIISPPLDLTRPPPPQVRVTGNNRTKSSLIGLTGVVKKSVGLGGWHWLVRRPASPLDGRSVGERVRSFEMKRQRTNTPPVRSTTDTHLRRFFVPDPPRAAETLHRPRVSSAEKRVGRDFATDRFRG